MSGRPGHHHPQDHDDPYTQSSPDVAHHISAPPTHDQDREKDDHELYMMTTSGRSRASTDGGAYVYPDDASAIHSVEIHPQHRGFKAVYYNPVIQVFFLGFVCFMGPGLFNALNGLGGGGLLEPTISANANSALYAMFAVAAFFAG